MSEKSFAELTKSDLFWREIHDYIDKKKFEIEKERTSKRKKSPERLCPVCKIGMELEEVEKILIDKCRQCGGIFLDHHELDLLYKTKSKSGFVASMRRFFAEK